VAETSVHNPDRYMLDLRQILSQGRKRIGLLVGAGAPVSIRVDAQNQLDAAGESLIPDVTGLTSKVLASLEAVDRSVIEKHLPQLGIKPTIETILTKLRRLAEAIGEAEIYGVNGPGYAVLAEKVCEAIGEKVSSHLPAASNPYTELVSWIGGTHRESAIEVFTPNYDLLFEEAFERAKHPYFDGFSGAHRPFFDSASISEDRLPARWSRLWKLHGSLGWEIIDKNIVRTGSRKATSLIFPDHLKYDQVSRQPYSALFERLRRFVSTPDTLLICSGFSFGDAHICAVLDEALSTNSHTAILAFQFRTLEEEKFATKLAIGRPNLSIYARDGAVIHGVKGGWQVGQSPNDDWKTFRQTYWGNTPEGYRFLLGDFGKLCRFFALTQAAKIVTTGVSEEKLELNTNPSLDPAAHAIDQDEGLV
jgi:hypothetical protein